MKVTPKLEWIFTLLHLESNTDLWGWGLTSLSEQNVKIFVLNLIITWPMGTAVTRQPFNPWYTYKEWELIIKTYPRIVIKHKFYLRLGHGRFFTIWSSQYFQNIYWRKIYLLMETFMINMIKSQSYNKFPFSCDFQGYTCLFPIQMAKFPFQIQPYF